MSEETATEESLCADGCVNISTNKCRIVIPQAHCWWGLSIIDEMVKDGIIADLRGGEVRLRRGTGGWHAAAKADWRKFNEVTERQGPLVAG